tara:strand:- start:271 stop:831 length:561 start_codon:yes stop_codon:yes gene_type:complete
MLQNYISFDIGIRNLAYCIIQYNTESKTCTIENWDIINLCFDGELVKQISLFQLCSRLINALNEKCIDSETIVIIENQPVLTNPKMKSIQMMVFTYFLMIGCEKVHLFSPRCKFYAYDGPVIECSLKSKYAQRKKLAIQYSKYFIKDNPEYTEFFITHKKKDDLSDCLLQALSFLKKNMKMEFELI